MPLNLPIELPIDLLMDHLLLIEIDLLLLLIELSELFEMFEIEVEIERLREVAIERG